MFNMFINQKEGVAEFAADFFSYFTVIEIEVRGRCATGWTGGPDRYNLD